MIWIYDALMNGMIERSGIGYENIYSSAFSCVGRSQSMYLSSSASVTPAWGSDGSRCWRTWLLLSKHACTRKLRER